MVGCQLLLSFSECFSWVYHSCGSFSTPKYNFALRAMLFIHSFLQFHCHLHRHRGGWRLLIQKQVVINLCDPSPCLFLVLQSYFSTVHNPNKPTTVMENLFIAQDECCFDMNCTTPRLFHYFALSEAKHYSSGILECPSLCPANSYAAGKPLRKYTFRTKGHLPAYCYLLQYPVRYFKPLLEMRC